jgi:hypothetical protein
VIGVPLKKSRLGLDGFALRIPLLIQFEELKSGIRSGTKSSGYEPRLHKRPANRALSRLVLAVLLVNKPEP